MAAQVEKITVTKLDAARRQVRTAVRLRFTGGDPVAIHTLAAAAHEIIHTIFRNRGFSGLLFDSLTIKDEYRSEWAKFLKESASFFKHAQRDADATIEFNLGKNLTLLLGCVQGLRKMGEPRELEDSAFLYWLRIHHPHWFLKAEGEDRLLVDHFEKLRGVAKDQFFNAFQLRWRERIPIKFPPRRRPRIPG